MVVIGVHYNSAYYIIIYIPMLKPYSCYVLYHFHVKISFSVVYYNIPRCKYVIKMYSSLRLYTNFQPEVEPIRSTRITSITTYTHLIKK